MSEAQLTFKREEREGVVPVGTYLSDAASRLGIRFEDKCSPIEGLHFCKVSIVEGASLLSPLTAVEVEQLSSNGQHVERLGCQARIDKPGDLVIMTTEGATKEPAAEAPTAKEYAKQFAELPLEKKISELVQLEAIALGETFSFVLNSPFLVFDKAVDILAGFGLKKEEREKNESRPKEHVDEPATDTHPIDQEDTKEDLDEPIPAE